MASYPNGVPQILDHRGHPFERHARNRLPVPDGAAKPGGIALPPGWMFVGQVGGGNNTMWLDRFDEAMRHARDDAKDMLLDCSIRALVQERILAFTSLKWHLEVPDEKDKFQVKVKDGLTRLAKGVRQMSRIVPWLGEGLWFGRAGVQVEWEWTKLRDEPIAPEEDDQQQEQATLQMMRGDHVLRCLRNAVQRDPGDAIAKKALAQRQQELGMPGKSPKKQGNPGAGQFIKGLSIRQAYPVQGDKIGHQYDGTPFVLLQGNKGYELPRSSIINSTIGRALSLRGTWREKFFISKWFMEDRDFFSPDESEAIFGVGVRSHIFWLRWMRQEFLGNATDFFSRVGLGVNLWKYSSGNPQALAAVQKAAEENTDRANIFIPVVPGEEAVDTLTRLEIPASPVDTLMKMIEYCDKAIERYIVGQEGSASATSSSGHSNKGSTEFQQQTKGNITLQDAAWCSEGLTGCPDEPSMLWMMQKRTYPEADFPVQHVFDVESKESSEKLTAIKTLVDMGVDVKQSDARDAAGVSAPADGDEVIQPPQQPGAGGPGAPGGGGGEDPLAVAMAGAGGASGPQGASPGEAQGEVDENGMPKPPPGFPPLAPEDEGDFAGPMQHAKTAEIRQLANVSGEDEMETLNQAMRHFRQRGRQDLADELLLAYARRYAKEDSKHHLHSEDDGKFVAKDKADSQRDKPTNPEKTRPAPREEEDAPERTTPHKPPSEKREEGTARPDRPMSPKERRESLAQTPVKRSEFLGGGCNVTRLLELADGSMGVFKPASGEEPYLRNSVPVGTYWRREIATSDVAEILGFDDLVPTTTRRKEGKEEGSIQRFVGGARDAASVPEKDRFDGEEDAGRAAAFDYITGQLDRHAGNWLVKEGKLVLIDNGLTFPNEVDRIDWYNVQFLRKAAKNDAVLPDLTGLRGRWDDVAASLARAGIESKAIALTKKRFMAATERKGLTLLDLPAPGGGDMYDLATAARD